MPHANTADASLLSAAIQQGLEHLQTRIRSHARQEGTTSALVTFLEARGLAMIPDEVAAIRGCTNHATIQRWLLRAPHVSAVAELFDDR